MYKKKLLASTAILVYLLILSGCREAVQPSVSRLGKTVFAFIDYNGLHDAGIDTTWVEAALRYSREKRVNNGGSSSWAADIANGYFTNSTGWTNISALTLNGNSVANAYAGNYDGGGNSFVSGAQSIWHVSGYNGASFYDTTTLPSEISVTNHSALDTVSASSGITLNYSGNSGGDLFVEITPDQGNNYSLIDSASAYNSNGFYYFFVPDNGSVVIPSVHLGSFTTNRYVRVLLSHFDYHVVPTSAGDKVGVLTTNSTSFPLYLSP